jgi:hypothetical protein
MNKEQFVINHRDVAGLVDDEKTRQLLKDLYDNICEKEIKLEEDDTPEFNIGGTQGRRVHFIKERQKILTMMKDKTLSSKKQNTFYEPQHVRHGGFDNYFFFTNF